MAGDNFEPIKLGLDASQPIEQMSMLEMATKELMENHCTAG